MCDVLNGSTPDKELVSVVVPTLESGSTLSLCLGSIQRQTYPKIEIVVVYQHSLDDTLAIARKFANRIILLPRPAYYSSPSVERNIGASYGNGYFLLHVDSDMELSPTVVEECVAMCERGFDALVIPEVDVGEGFWSTCKKLERTCTLQYPVVEAARFFTRRSFEMVKGYDQPAISTEDWVIHRKLVKASLKIGRTKAKIIHHLGRMSLQRHLLKKYHYGRKARSFIFKDPSFAFKVLSPIKPTHLRNWRLLVKDPTHALGMSFLRGYELLCALIGSLAGP